MAFPMRVYEHYSSDNPTTWAKHLQFEHSRDKAIKHGWYDTNTKNMRNSIEYKLTEEDEYRTDEFNEVRDFMFIGCSCTFGVGIQYNDRLDQIVQRNMGFTSYNVAKPGIGWEGYYRILSEKLQYANTIVVIPPYSYARREIQLENKTILITPQQPEGHSNAKLSYKPYELLCETETKVMVQRMLDAIKWLCYRNNKNVIVTPRLFVQRNNDMGARDLQHPGKNVHLDASILLERKMRKL